MSADVVVHHVTYTARELGMRLTHRWRFLSVEEGEVLIHGERVAQLDKRGPRVQLYRGIRPDLVRWVGWAIQEICPGAEAEDPNAGDEAIKKPPLADDDVEGLVLGMREARLEAIAKAADPSGGAREAVGLVTYLIERGRLEVSGSVANVARAVAPLLVHVTEDIGSQLEEALLEVDDVDELFADAEELRRVVENNEHIFNR